jgi:hypothetical protein
LTKIAVAATILRGMLRRGILLGVLWGLVSGCSDDKSSSGDSSDGGTGQSGSAGDAGDSGAAGSATGGRATGGSSSGGEATGGSSGSEATGGTTGGSTTGGSGGGEPVPLPPGSREVGGIVNLVDAGAAEELEIFFTVEEPVFVTRREDLVRSFNLFVDHYLEEYDFVFFYTDHPITNAFASGIFQALKLRAEPGGSSEIEIALGGYKTNGRTRGVIAMNYSTNFFGPLPHEVLHYWANALDTRFGFGIGLNEDFGSHWGYASVNGQLGGFDGATLRCETPANAMPPACTPLASGRTRYVVGDFAPFTNSYRSVPYSPLELYLMGLAPASEVPQSFQVLIEGTIVTPETQGTGGTVVVEADGIDTVTFAEITARHGMKPMLPAAERAMRAAFVVISAEPASDAVMNDVARMAAAFGARETVANWDPFEMHTLGRATLDTELGARRDTEAPAPAPRELFECDVVAQDCPRDELGCYLRSPTFCALSGGVELDQPCDAPFACAPGLDCVASNANPTAFVCKPYCDPTSTTSADSCEILCPGRYEEYQTTAGVVLGGLCFPE